MIKKYVSHLSFYDGEYNKALVIFINALSDDPNIDKTIRNAVLETDTAKEYIQAGFHLDNMTVDEVPVDICPSNSGSPICVLPDGVFIKSSFLNSNDAFKNAFLDLVSIYSDQTNL